MMGTFAYNMTKVYGKTSTFSTAVFIHSAMKERERAGKREMRGRGRRKTKRRMRRRKWKESEKR